MKEFIIIVANLIIFIACDLNRKEDKIRFLSKWWFVRLLMVTIAGIMLINYT